MKKITVKALALFLIIILGFSALAGCGKDNEENNNQNIFFTVKFNLNGGEGTVPDQLIKKSQKASEPFESPVRAGYNFSGWYKTDRNTGFWNFETDAVNSDITLYAGWTERNDNYEATMDWSESDHLYFHYLRYKNTEDDYSEWNMWVWPMLGSGVSFDWVRFDESGAIADIDMSVTYTNGGKTGTDNVNYHDDEHLGFLIVLKESKLSSEGMWVSDGSADTIIPNIFDHVRNDGSIHIFIRQGYVSEYSFTYSEEELPENPYEGLEPGEAESIVNVESSKTKYLKAPTSSEFLNDGGVGYSIQVASFADSDEDGMGDIKGITESLNYLHDTLNVKVLWLTPIQLSDSYHGYDVIDYFKIDPKFGTMEDYRELLFEAHKRGMKVLMDLVPNHSSANNVWFKKSARLDPQYRNFYWWRYGDGYKNKDYWYQYSDTGYYFYGKFASSMPELNYDFQGTRDAIVNAALYWLSFGLDGFRVDAVKHIYNEDEYDTETKAPGDIIHYEKDNNGVDYSRNVTKNVNFFREFNARVKSVYPGAFLVGENFEGNPMNTAPYYAGLDSQFNFNFYYDIMNKAVNTANGATGFAADYGSKLGLYDAYRANTAIDSLMTSNHDITRLLNHTASDAALTYGSAAALSAISKSKIIAATTLTLPGISWIYYGDELGMSGYKKDNLLTDNDGNPLLDNDGNQLTNNYHADRWFRQPFKWAKQKTEDTRITEFRFQTYEITWDDYNKQLDGVKEQLADNNSTLAHFKKLTLLKTTDEVLQRGTYEALNTANKNLFAFKRSYNGKTYFVYHNYSNATVTGFNLGGSQIKFQSSSQATINSLPPYGSLILAV